VQHARHGVGQRAHTCDVYILIEELQQGQAGVVHAPQLSARAIWRKQPGAHRKEFRSFMPAQPRSPTMDSRLSVRPRAPTPKFPRRSNAYASNFMWGVDGPWSFVTRQ